MRGPTGFHASPGPPSPLLLRLAYRAGLDPGDLVLASIDSGGETLQIVGVPDRVRIGRSFAVSDLRAMAFAYRLNCLFIP